MMRSGGNIHIGVLIIISLMIYVTPQVTEWLLVNLSNRFSELSTRIIAWSLSIAMILICSILYVANVKNAHYIFIAMGVGFGLLILYIKNRFDNWWG